MNIKDTSQLIHMTQLCTLPPCLNAAEIADLQLYLVDACLRQLPPEFIDIKHNLKADSQLSAFM